MVKTKEETEISSIVIGGKAHIGELVLYNNKLSVFTKGVKFGIINFVSTNTRENHLYDLELDSIKYITYNNGIPLIRFPSIQIFVKKDKYTELIKKMKEIARFGGIFVLKNDENKLEFQCGKVPPQMSKKFVERVQELVEQ